MITPKMGPENRIPPEESGTTPVFIEIDSGELKKSIDIKQWINELVKFFEKAKNVFAFLYAFCIVFIFIMSVKEQKHTVLTKTAELFFIIYNMFGFFFNLYQLLRNEKSVNQENFNKIMFVVLMVFNFAFFTHRGYFCYS